ncbi:MAG: hypothetical protein LBL30_00920 [Holosporales bacterium]|nr:hypothetical protein [Holosporales bacterium]
MNKKLLLSMAVVGAFCSDVCLSDVEQTNPAPSNTAEYQHNLMQKMKNGKAGPRLFSNQFSVTSPMLGASVSGRREGFPVKLR